MLCNINSGHKVRCKGYRKCPCFYSKTVNRHNRLDVIKLMLIVNVYTFNARNISNEEESISIQHKNKVA